MNILTLTEAAQQQAEQDRQRHTKLQRAVSEACRADIMAVVEELVTGLEYEVSDWHNVLRGDFLTRVCVEVSTKGFLPFWAFVDAKLYTDGTNGVLPVTERPVDVVLTTENPTRNTHLSERIGYHNSDTAAKAQFFKKLKDRYEEKQARIRLEEVERDKHQQNERINHLYQVLSTYHTSHLFATSVEKAGDALQELISLDASRGDEFREF